jgi:predicted CXXCH cytochrome family protein
MKAWTVVAGISVAAVLVTSCDATSRYRVLSFFFDGVPPPMVAEEDAGQQVAASAGGAQSRKVGFREHGPYAAKLCGACHESAASNTFVVPRDQLCFRCHEFKVDKKYVHGPLASGGCTACHDPHSSRYRYFLLSESDSFCLRCHDSQAIARVGAHAGIGEECTSCHDPHMSDKKYLLR